MEKKALEQAVFSVVETTVRNMDVIQRVNIPEISLQANLKQDLGLDSLSLAELSVRLENEFGVDVYEENIPETVGDIIKILS
jgi:acyl carrier protein